MLVSIASDIPGRLRLRTNLRQLSDEEARGISYSLRDLSGVQSCEVHPLNGSIVVACAPEAREQVLERLRNLETLNLPSAEAGLGHWETAFEIALENNRFQTHLAYVVVRRFLRQLFLPLPIRMAFAAYYSARIIRAGLRCLWNGQLTVEVLDATALSAAMARGAFTEAGTIAFLLQISGILEEHVQSRARLALRDGLIVRAETVWAQIDGQDTLVNYEDITPGMILHIREGAVFPVDGELLEGSAEIDEASLTGESLPVAKGPGARVFAGTALKQGDILIEAKQAPGNSRIDAIARLVEGSSALKASVQSKAEHLADSIVPFSFLAFFSVWALTGSIRTASALLMVDYSCAIKLSTPIAVMSAMDEASRHGAVVRGGKYLEALAEADTIVFDKTGTLTNASPQVKKVFAFGSESEEEVLRLAACIEEHFPHSMARAIVAEAQRRKISHEHEMHAKVQYIVAHGIATRVGDHDISIGSAHFLFDDEGVEFPEEAKKRLEQEAEGSSLIYLARDKKLLAAIAINDPARSEAAEVIAQLKQLGIKQVMMLTGDHDSCARQISNELGIDTYYAQVLPEDKSRIIEELKAEGKKVIMVGDGINDSPALAAANVSIALADASDVARSVADILVMKSSLIPIVELRDLAQKLMERIQRDYNVIVASNTSFIIGGLLGVLSLSQAAYLHNISTVMVAAANARHLLPEIEDES